VALLAVPPPALRGRGRLEREADGVGGVLRVVVRDVHGAAARVDVEEGRAVALLAAVSRGRGGGGDGGRRRGGGGGDAASCDPAPGRGRRTARPHVVVAIVVIVVPEGGGGRGGGGGTGVVPLAPTVPCRGGVDADGVRVGARPGELQRYLVLLGLTGLEVARGRALDGQVGDPGEELGREGEGERENLTA
jgi:hypothetical protein